MSNKKQRRLAILAGGLVALLGFQAVSAVAQEDDSRNPFSFSVSQTFMQDSNLYRLPSSSSLPSTYKVPKEKRSDTVSFTSVGVNFDGEVSRQSFHAGVNVSRALYRTHSDLNNTSLGANLRWDWRVGDRVSGVFGYSYSESFVGFDNNYVGANPDDREKLMRQLGRVNFSADYWWHPNWATGFGVSSVRSNYNNSDNDKSLEKYNAQTVSLNLTYRPSTGNRIVLSVQSEEGDYPEQYHPERHDKLGGEKGLMREWERRDAKLSGQWRLSGVTQVDGYVGYTKRKYEYASNRDFSGVTGKIGFQWTPTGKAIIDLSWRREIGADQDLISNYAVTKALALRPTWVVTSKVRLGASYERRDRKYGGDPGYYLPISNPKNAKSTVYGLNLQYLPTSSGSIVLNFQRDKRNAEEEVYGYRARIVSLSGSWTF